MEKKRNLTACILAMLLAVLAVALGGCDANPPESACLDSGNPFCSNYTPPSGSGGSGGTNNGGTGGSGGNTNVNCGALPSFNCFGQCVVLTSDEANCGSCGRACASGQSCQDGYCAWDIPPDQCAPSAEVCDNTDNDCDGTIDEESNLFTDASNCGTCGRACGAGQSCVSSHCQWDAPQDSCVPTGAETCNYADDDCDGALDEGINLLADNANCGQCGHTCGGGQHCDNGHCAWDVPQDWCSPTSSGELCDNIDNDCNGDIDEGINPLTDNANCGTCGNSCGTDQHCANGHCAWDSPQDSCVPTATTEVCDWIDNDCNGKIDEIYNLQNDVANCGTCGRACGPNQICQNSVCKYPVPPDNCVPEPAEICDSRDNNCDGWVDEGYNPLTDPQNCGQCGRVCNNAEACSNGHCQIVVPVNVCMSTASAEVCDYTDNDCDGAIDEGIIMLQDEANCGTCGNVCAADQVCDNGHCQWIHPQNECVPTGAETCNSNDDDCDGVIDDGFDRLIDPLNCGICGRTCATGQHCQNGACSWDTPPNGCVPTDEVCDNIDNNCNAGIDEGINLSTDQANCGSCGTVCATNQICANGRCQWTIPQNGCTPAAETCNYEDDDCDTVIDDGFDRLSDEQNCGTCGNACAANQVCTNGHCMWSSPQNNCTPSAEICDNIDNNCNRVIDEGINLANDNLNCGKCGVVCGTNEYCLNGQCAHTLPINVCAPSTEVCDHIDNDCDGDIDEGINLANDAANCGTCGRVCGAGQHCQAGTCAWNVPVNGCVPVMEICDNADNDCDQQIDEGFDLQHDEQNCGQCGTVCAAGQHCESGACAWNTPQSGCVPTAEICDGIDNDCDTVLDDGYVLATDEANCGTCGNACGANQYCANGHCAWLVLPDQCAPSAEICDGIDNDCDRDIDEGFLLASDEGNCGTCGRTCDALQHCSAGTCVWNTPQNVCPNTSEICDGVDNDCDSLIDEGFALTADPLNCGTCGHVCAAGQHCQNGACAWDTLPSTCVDTAEVCDDIDNDCDGLINEGYLLSSDEANCGQCGHVCGAGQHCENSHCAWNTPQNSCNPSAEVCDNTDNDCDGAIDENTNLSNNASHCGHCGNQCAAGQHCENSACAWDIPVDNCAPSAEVCDSIDNDCDGAIDESTPLASDEANCGGCGHTCATLQHCEAGHCTWDTPISSCGPGTVEVCDNADNDCDQAIDEGWDLSSDEANCGTCGHVCATGQHCTSGACVWDIPQNVCTPSAEVCDGIDNDCDTIIDDGINMSSNPLHCGSCETSCGTNQHCAGGHCTWDTPQNGCVPSAEICDNVDNDCDRVIDEGWNLTSDPANCGTCGRTCGAGQICQSGKCQYTLPQSQCSPVAETCDYSDNDCDGVIDDGFPLASSNAHCGVCNHACAVNQTCVNGHCTWNQPQSQCVATAETCNQADDDCDGLIDENWNLLTDEAHCGNCTTVCPGTQFCQNGRCMSP